MWRMWGRSILRVQTVRGTNGTLGKVIADAYLLRIAETNVTTVRGPNGDHEQLWNM